MRSGLSGSHRDPGPKISAVEAMIRNTLVWTAREQVRLGEVGCSMGYPVHGVYLIRVLGMGIVQ